MCNAQQTLCVNLITDYTLDTRSFFNNIMDISRASIVRNTKNVSMGNLACSIEDPRWMESVETNCKNLISERYTILQVLKMAIKPFYCIYGKLIIPQRYVLCFMIFLGVLFSYTMRVCLQIAIVEIAVPINKQNKNLTDPCPHLKEEVIHIEGGTKNWTSQEQGHILGAFFPGYVITHLPGGFMADLFGAKHVFGGGLAISAVFTILTPLIIYKTEWWGICMARCLIGLSQGPVYPCLSTFLAKWVPLKERAGLGAFVNTGNQIGAIVGNLGSSNIIADVGWPMVFYVWGILSGIWYILFLMTCYSEPSKHPHVTEAETRMLYEDIGPSPKLKVPWLKIICDPVVWGLLGGQVGHDLIFFVMVVQLPTYVKNVLKFNIKQNGILNSIPYLCLWVSSVLSGIFADYVIGKNWVSVLRMRQVYTLLGNVLPGACIVAATYMECQRIVVSTIFVLGMFLMGPFYAGMKVNVLDVSKNFAGIIMAIVNGIGSLSYVPVPSVTALVTKNNSFEEWRMVFIVLFAICVTLTFIYILLASDKRAEWDKIED